VSIFELLGRLSLCFVWGFVSALAVTLLVRHFGKFEISLATPDVWYCIAVQKYGVRIMNLVSATVLN